MAGVRICPNCRLVYNKMCVGGECGEILWGFDESKFFNNSHSFSRQKIKRKAGHRWNDFIAKTMRMIIKQFFICQQKSLDRVP